tara:strand:+ start:16275 stop:17453 length:1179 start_codon:yes stop_codon:yes gene_type:complete
MLNTILNRQDSIFSKDFKVNEKKISHLISKSSFLILGGAGSIGQAVVKLILKYNPQRLHVVDISENNLVELVRDVRSQDLEVIDDFKTFPIDIGSKIYDSFFNDDGNYDYIVNLSALKHVRSEKNYYSMSRMIEVNVLNTVKTIEQAIQKNIKKYFCVSSDKATNPENFMGATKRAMELILFYYSNKISVSSARFANVAFSDGSLLDSFNNRLKKRQPISAPNDVKRYFMSANEAGELCLFSTLFGKNREIYLPKLSKDHLKSFKSIAEKFLKENGYEPYLCDENEAKKEIIKLVMKKKWPCVFNKSNTTGEKMIEEFYGIEDQLDKHSYKKIAFIKNELVYKQTDIKEFLNDLIENNLKLNLSKQGLIKLFRKIIPEFKHFEYKSNLDEKM